MLLLACEGRIAYRHCRSPVEDDWIDINWRVVRRLSTLPENLVYVHNSFNSFN